MVWPPPRLNGVDVTDAYDRLAELGYDYGPAVPGIAGGVAAGRGGVRRGRPAEAWDREAACFGLHPALLDAALHPLCSA